MGERLRLEAALAVALTCLAAGCGGAEIPGARWIDERTVVLPPGSITFDWAIALRAQVAHEHGCPEDDVEIADPFELGELTAIPVRACGAPIYYARIDDAFVDVSATVLQTEPAGVSPAPVITAPAAVVPTEEEAPVEERAGGETP